MTEVRSQAQGSPAQSHRRRIRRQPGPARCNGAAAPGRSPLFLLQQPEVHLHPSAQAALGSLFCRVASPDRQLIVETHSDHLLDRVRMEVRDGESNLKPEDVSILYFERGDLDVNMYTRYASTKWETYSALPTAIAVSSWKRRPGLYGRAGRLLRTDSCARLSMPTLPTRCSAPTRRRRGMASSSGL